MVKMHRKLMGFKSFANKNAENGVNKLPLQLGPINFFLLPKPFVQPVTHIGYAPEYLSENI